MKTPAHTDLKKSKTFDTKLPTMSISHMCFKKDCITNQNQRVQ